MADITMCAGTGCPLRETCYRYTATPNEHWQSFADFTPNLETDDAPAQRNKCSMHIANEAAGGKRWEHNAPGKPPAANEQNKG